MEFLSKREAMVLAIGLVFLILAFYLWSTSLPYPPYPEEAMVRTRQVLLLTVVGSCLLIAGGIVISVRMIRRP